MRAAFYVCWESECKSGIQYQQTCPLLRKTYKLASEILWSFYFRLFVMPLAIRLNYSMHVSPWPPLPQTPRPAVKILLCLLSELLSIYTSQRCQAILWQARLLNFIFSSCMTCINADAWTRKSWWHLSRRLAWGFMAVRSNNVSRLFSSVEGFDIQHCHHNLRVITHMQTGESSFNKTHIYAV